MGWYSLTGRDEGQDGDCEEKPLPAPEASTPIVLDVVVSVGHQRDKCDGSTQHRLPNSLDSWLFGEELPLNGNRKKYRTKDRLKEAKKEPKSEDWWHRE